MRQGFWDKRKGMEGTKVKILGAKEELEVEILDPNWEAGIQSSESFLLDYYESFLKQHEWQFFRDGAINHTKAILDAVNTDKVPATELVKLRSFLQIIVNYIMRGQGGKESKNAGAFSDVKGLPAKQAFTLMSRTNFASIYRWLLTEKEKKLFQKIVKTDAILKEMGLDRESPVFIKGYGTERHEPGPTVYKWLSGIPKGVDLLSTLSGKGLSAAMGRYSVETRKGKKDRWHVKFETRNTTMGAVRIKARDWVKYASKLFDLASNRELDSLKLVYKQGITDENKLTNFVFYAHHPEMGGRKIRSDALAQKWLQTRDDLVRPFLLSAQPELETFEAFDDAEFEDEEFQDEFENGAETSYGYTNYELAGEEEHPFYEMENDEDLTEIEANSTETEEEELENEFLREDDYSPSYIENNEDMQTYEGLEPLIQGEIGEIDQAIRTAKKQMQVHYNLQMKYAAGAGKTNNGTAARKEMAKYWEWSHERDFLERLKAVYESQTGVPLNYRSYPVTKVDPNTGKSGKDNPWRPSTKRQIFQQLEADGSFCLGASRAMAFRAIFGLDKPSNRAVLTDLKKKIEAARASGNTDAEARLIISRIVSHSHDPGSMKQFNHDLASRYGIKNTIVRAASRSEAFDALKKGAPIIADLEGGWHWVLVQKSPRGQLWANDPLLGSGIRKISSSELGSRFEIIIDAKTGEPITLNKAPEYQN
jgi:predicted small secreted protein